MTSRPPTRRLVDVLKQNSKKTLERHAAELAAAATSLPAEAIQTRFLRNQFLINPKSLHLLANEELLSRWHVFGLYKPPFCPMRKAAAQDNYHHVSVESFVESALRSKAVYPVLLRTLKPAEMQVRVLYNLDAFASGPVAVALSNQYQFATSLSTMTMEYDVLVNGHLPVHGTGNHTKIDVQQLFPSTSQVACDMAAPITTKAYFEVKGNGYYSVHPVSLLNVVIKAPPTSQPPALERFAREQLGACVMGDPLVMGKVMQLCEYKQASSRDSGSSKRNSSVETTIAAEGKALSGDAAAHAAAEKLAANPHIVSMRGDCDFPRVFMHLREIRIDVSREQSRLTPLHGTASASDVGVGGAPLAYNFPLFGTPSQQHEEFAQKQSIEMHCRKCFDGLVQKQLNSSFKARRISLLDGTWTPQVEFL